MNNIITFGESEDEENRLQEVVDAMRRNSKPQQVTEPETESELVEA